MSVNTKNQINVAGYAYDSAGNLIAAPPTGTTYTYDAENHLTSTAGQTYLYDGDGKRVEKASGSPLVANKLYSYGTDSSPIIETDPPGNELFRYFRFQGLLVTREESNDWVDHYGLDALGNVRWVYGTNSGSPYIVDWDTSDYYTFGGERVVQANSINRYKFTSKERDSESGNDNFGARFYSPTMGRFTSPDPINLTAKRLINPANTLNKYIYGGNNPLLYVDPTGKDITFFYRRGNGLNDQGHFALSAINQASGQVGTLNFNPTQRNLNTVLNSVPGANLPLNPSDVATGNFASLTIRTTPEEAQKVIQWINQVSINPPDYNLFTTNCSTMCVEAMEVLGVDLDAGLFGFHPDVMWDTVFTKYSDIPAFITNHAPFQPGRDFGNPRYRGISTYQLADLYYRLWLYQNQAQREACTTILVPDSEGGSKSETQCN